MVQDSFVANQGPEAGHLAKKVLQADASMKLQAKSEYLPRVLRSVRHALAAWESGRPLAEFEGTQGSLFALHAPPCKATSTRRLPFVCGGSGVYCCRTNPRPLSVSRLVDCGPQFFTLTRSNAFNDSFAWAMMDDD